MTDTLTDPLATPAVAHVDRMRGHRFRPPRADLNRIPPIYAQENTPTDEQIVHLHYFLGGNDWWITEYDPATGEAFGWARVGGNDRPELGYLNHPIFGDDPAGMPVISVHDDGIWFRDDAGESSIDTTANVVCWLLEQPKGPVEPVVFEWVSLSSKPEIDSFHGGAVRCVPGRWTCKHTSDLIDLLNKEAEA